MRCRRCGRELHEGNVCSECGAQTAQSLLSGKNIACCLSCATVIFLLVCAVIAVIKLGGLSWFDEAFKDSSKVKQEKTQSNISKVIVNPRYLTFGSYPQSGNSRTDREPIEWLILESDGETAFLLSKYGLDCQPFNSINVATNWRDCDLRRWLNKDFFYKAFSDSERKCILETKIDTVDNPTCHTKGCGKTKDKIFCLSFEEASDYFGNDTGKRIELIHDNASINPARACTPTAFAINQGVCTVSSSREFRESFGIPIVAAHEPWFDYCFFWLRSPGRSPNCAPDINLFGGIGWGGNDVDSDYIAVRPAMRIKLASNGEKIVP